MKRLTTFILFSFFCSTFNAQPRTDTIKIHFLYGSKPAKGHKASESKVFGGLKGGHVNIEANDRILDFMPGKCPLFPHNKKPSGGFRLNSSVFWDTSGDKWSTILVPVSETQMKYIDSLFTVYSDLTPFDYAVFGMRCAAASYYVLSKTGLLKQLSNRKNIIRHFYPKLLRKKMYSWARKNNYTIIEHSGKNSRKWEKDKGLL